MIQTSLYAIVDTTGAIVCVGQSEGYVWAIARCFESVLDGKTNEEYVAKRKSQGWRCVRGTFTEEEHP